MRPKFWRTMRFTMSIGRPAPIVTSTRRTFGGASDDEAPRNTSVELRGTPGDAAGAALGVGPSAEDAARDGSIEAGGSGGRAVDVGAPPELPWQANPSSANTPSSFLKALSEFKYSPR